jgi:hypothetical protein
MQTSKLAYQDGVIAIKFKGQEFLCRIDSDDVDLIHRECSAIHITEVRPGAFYARVYSHGVQVLLQRFLLGLQPHGGKVGDHKNGDTLDYRRENLRVLEHDRNCLNKTGVRSDSGTGVRGVYRHIHGWRAQVKLEQLGIFRDIRDAVEAVWLRLLADDPIAATNYLRSIPVN